MRRGEILEKFFKTALLVIIGIMVGGVSFFADALTWKQENLVGLANKFAVVISDFEADGPLSPGSVKSHVASTLSELGVTVVPETSSTPLGLVTVNVVKEPGKKEGDYLYQIDLNIYNMKTINTTYTLRKGTVWRMGSYTVIPGDNFPFDVEEKITLLLQYFARDYFAANTAE